MYLRSMMSKRLFDSNVFEMQRLCLLTSGFGSASTPRRRILKRSNAYKDINKEPLKDHGHTTHSKINEGNRCML